MGYVDEAWEQELSQMRKTLLKEQREINRQKKRQREKEAREASFFRSKNEK